MSTPHPPSPASAPDPLWRRSGWWPRRRRRAALRPLKSKPRRIAGRADLGEWAIDYVDGPSAYWAYRSIFGGHIYDFEAPAGRPPRIIDGGANVGVAIRYWLSRFKNPDLVAFEADPAVFGVLERNCAAWGGGVRLRREALWCENTTLTFAPEGADAGRVALDGSGSGRIRVPAVRLRDVLERLKGPVDLLKLDIEGAETRVLADCRDHLGGVQRVFVEHHGYADRAQDLHTLLGTLGHAGFRYHVQPELVAARPFDHLPIDAGMDQRLNVFAVRA